MTFRIQENANYLWRLSVSIQNLFRHLQAQKLVIDAILSTLPTILIFSHFLCLSSQPLLSGYYQVLQDCK